MTETEQSYFRNPLAEFVAVRSYLRWNPEQERRETWVEAVDRVVNFLVETADGQLTSDDIADIRDEILHLNVLPAMRIFAMGTEAVKKDNVAAQNCSYLTIDSIDALVEVALILQQGTGVGYSVERRYTEKLPVVSFQHGGAPLAHTIADSSEGWGQALRVGLEQWFSGGGVTFDYSLIRPAGARLKTKGGRASGPGPLRDLLEFTKKMLLAAQGRRLRPIEVSDVCNQVACVVVVGGTRRSSEISLSDLDDSEMRDAKKGKFWETAGWRAMSNNSAVFNEKPSHDVFIQEWEALRDSQTGERGIFSRAAASNLRPAWRKDAEWGTNPCFAPGTMIHTSEGHRPIESLVGKVVYIWNGTAWQAVDNFRVTATDQPILKITLRDGTVERVTPYHTVILDNGRRIEARKLRKGDALALSNAPGVVPSLDNRVLTVEDDGSEPLVYCCTVEGSHSLALSSGYLMSQCGEILLRPNEFCNLSSVVSREDDTEENLVRKVRLATIIGTIQSKLTYFPNLRPIWEANVKEERLLGVSLSGSMQSPVARDPAVQRRLKAVAEETNRVYADRFGIPSSAAICCVKPEGTSSIISSSTSGMHPSFSRWYIRRVRINSTDPLYRLIRDAGVPLHPEVGQSAETATIWVAEFPMKCAEGAITRHDMTALEQLEYWKQVKLEYCHHNPSQTIYMEEHEWNGAVPEWIFDNFDIIGGLSFLPKDSGVYLLAPMEDITEDQYNRRVESFPFIDYSLLSEYERTDMTEGSMEYSCIGDKCSLE